MTSTILSDQYAKVRQPTVHIGASVFLIPTKKLHVRARPLTAPVERVTFLWQCVVQHFGDGSRSRHAPLPTSTVLSLSCTYLTSRTECTSSRCPVSRSRMAAFRSSGSAWNSRPRRPPPRGDGGSGLPGLRGGHRDGRLCGSARASPAPDQRQANSGSPAVRASRLEASAAGVYSRHDPHQYTVIQHCKAHGTAERYHWHPTANSAICEVRPPTRRSHSQTNSGHVTASRSARSMRRCARSARDSSSASSRMMHMNTWRCRSSIDMHFCRPGGFLSGLSKASVYRNIESYKKILGFWLHECSYLRSIMSGMKGRNCPIVG